MALPPDLHRLNQTRIIGPGLIQPAPQSSSPILGLLLLAGAGFGGYYGGGMLAKDKKDDEALYYKIGGAAIGVVGMLLLSRQGIV